MRHRMEYSDSAVARRRANSRYTHAEKFRQQGEEATRQNDLGAAWACYGKACEMYQKAFHDMQSVAAHVKGEERHDRFAAIALTAVVCFAAGVILVGGGK